MLEINKAYLMDCFDGFKKLDDKSINLIILDPPYNIGKDKWDKFESHEKYLEFMSNVFSECQRVLKDNGSLYCWHNKMETLSDFMQIFKNETEFCFKNLITWNKKFKGVYNEGFLQGFNEVENLRNYQKFAEYCLFYTFQDSSGLSVIKTDINNFKPLRDYSKKVLDYINLPISKINKKLGHRKVEHFFYWKSTQWELGLESVYNDMCDVFKVVEMSGYQEYESLRQEYESLRYPFNNQKTHHSVWNYPIEKSDYHLTPKNLEMCKNIILHSSNENDLVLIPFLGSGQECKASKILNRNFIAFETNEDYVNRFNKDIEFVNVETEIETEEEGF